MPGTFKAPLLIEASAHENKAEMMAALERWGGVDRFVGKAGLGNNVRGITRRLEEAGVRFADIETILATGESEEAVARSAQKLAAKKVLKKVAIAGIVISVAMDASELNAAEEQDELFRSMIADYQTMDSSFELSARLHHAGVTRAALGVAGEEGGTWGGAVGGAALVGALGLPTGPGALAAAAGGAVAGGYGGGVFGRWLGNRVADILEPE